MVCWKCKIDKPKECFALNNKGCRPCMATYAREKRAIARGKGYCIICCNVPSAEKYKMCERCRVRHSKYSKVDSQRVILAVLDAYGGRHCACCGEKNILFLTVDHINGGGAKHRKSIGNGHIYRWLKRQGYPIGYQILCFNCNCGRARNGGICPHKVNANG